MYIPSVVGTPSPPGLRGHPTRPQLKRVERGNPVVVRAAPAWGGVGRPTVRRAGVRGGNRTPKKRMPAAERQREKRPRTYWSSEPVVGRITGRIPGPVPGRESVLT
jgi:hypothetical protein